MVERWLYDKKQRLDLLIEVAKRAESEVTAHLRSLITHLLQEYLKSSKSKIDGGPTGFIVDGVSDLIGLTFIKNEYLPARNKAMAKRESEKTLLEEQVKNLIWIHQLMEVKQLRTAMEHLIEKGPQGYLTLLSKQSPDGLPRLLTFDRYFNSEG